MGYGGVKCNVVWSDEMWRQDPPANNRDPCIVTVIKFRRPGINIHRPGIDIHRAIIEIHRPRFQIPPTGNQYPPTIGGRWVWCNWVEVGWGIWAEAGRGMVGRVENGLCTVGAIHRTGIEIHRTVNQ